MKLARHNHRRRARIRGRGYFKRLGPGFVTGAADDDPSGIGTYSQVGAAYGLGLLWSTVYVAPMAAAVQEAAARLGVTSQKGLATLIRERLPTPVLYAAVTLTAVGFYLAAPPIIVLMLLLARSSKVVGRWRSDPLGTTLLIVTIVAGVLAPVGVLLAS